MTNGNSRRSFEILLIILSFVVSGLISISLGQDRNWDLRNYHFYNAYSFLNDRLTYDIAPAQIQSFYNPLLDLPFYWMMTRLKPIVCGFLVGGLQGINIWLVYKITHAILIGVPETGRRLLSVATGVAGYYGAANLTEIGTTFGDNITSLFVLSALLLALSSLSPANLHSNNASKRNFIIAGFLLGCATGLKLPVATYSLAFALSMLFLRFPWKMKVSNTVLSSLGVCLGILTTMGYWMTILWRNFQSPLFAYYNKIFHSPYYVLANFYDDRFFPRDKYQVLFYPFYFLKHSDFVSEVSFRDIRLPLCYSLLALFFFMIFYKRIARTYGGQELKTELKFTDEMRNAGIHLMVFFVLSYVIWQYMFSIYRYIVPLELLSPVFVILVMRYIFPFERILFRVSLGIFAVMIVTTSPMNWRRVSWTGSYFDVRIPQLKNIASSTVIMADNEPLSYIIPSFPESTRFVSIKNNFMRPALQDGLQERVEETLRNCRESLYLLYKGKSREDYSGILAFYDLKMNRQKGVKISTKFDDDLYLVPVFRME